MRAINYIGEGVCFSFFFFTLFGAAIGGWSELMLMVCSLWKVGKWHLPAEQK